MKEKPTLPHSNKHGFLTSRTSSYFFTKEKNENLKHTKKIQWDVSFSTQSQDLPYAEQIHHHSHELLSHTSTTDTGKHSHIESRAGEYEHCTRSLYLNLRKNALTVLWCKKETDNKKEESLTHGL